MHRFFAHILLWRTRLSFVVFAMRVKRVWQADFTDWFKVENGNRQNFYYELFSMGISSVRRGVVIKIGEAEISFGVYLLFASGHFFL